MNNIQFILGNKQTVFSKKDIASLLNISIEEIVTEQVTFNELIGLCYKYQTEEAKEIIHWASALLENYVKDGFSIDVDRLKILEAEKLKDFKNVINLITSEADLPLLQGKEKELLALIDDYSSTWSIFSNYDEGQFKVDSGKQDINYELTYENSLEIIQSFKSVLVSKNEASDLFGNESSGLFKATLGVINQSYAENMLYPSIEEKAANLLYLIIKDHPFTDGNKRIASMLFVYFLEKNNFSWKVSNERKINDNALVALALLIAASRPDEKEIMTNLVIKLIQNDRKS